MKCPSCGSTAQVRMNKHETRIWKDSISVYLVYKCGCGCKFVTNIEVNRNEEKLYGVIEKGG